MLLSFVIGLPIAQTLHRATIETWYGRRKLHNEPALMSAGHDVPIVLIIAVNLKCSTETSLLRNAVK